MKEFKKHWFDSMISTIRNWRSRELFAALREYCQGDVLDVGGWDFFLTARKPDSGIRFSTWTNIEPDPDQLLEFDDQRYKAMVGDGCAMTFPDNRFDSVVNLHVLEHVAEPNKMVAEIYRVLKPGGYAFFLFPQTGVLHMIPHHYYNFMPFWATTIMPKIGFEIVQQKGLGGYWTTAASRFVHFFFQSLRISFYSDKKLYKRNVFFYLLYPVMAVYALVSIPFCLLLSIGDLGEEANNQLVVVRKPTL